MNRLIGSPEIHPDALAQMRGRSEPGDIWAAFQSHDMSSETLGQLRFLQCGPERTYKIPPDKYPDTQYGLGWRFLLVGKVNLETGEIAAQVEQEYRNEEK